MTSGRWQVAGHPLLLSFVTGSTSQRIKGDCHLSRAMSELYVHNSSPYATTSLSFLSPTTQPGKTSNMTVDPSFVPTPTNGIAHMSTTSRPSSLPEPVVSLGHTSLPPCYTSRPPPMYSPIPQDTESSLLLAPPPRYTLTNCGCDPESHRCRHRFKNEHQALHDRFVFLLVILNILIWSAVFVCYWQEWRNGGVLGHIVGHFDIGHPSWNGDETYRGGWERLFMGDLCAEESVACTELTRLASVE